MKDLQGSVIPQFLYHGSDFNYFWATAATTYEGVSLEMLSSEGENLPAGAKAHAIDSLRAIHAQGVLHDDVALRNAVWRLSDRTVLWIDFERCTVLDEDLDAEKFAVEARAEEMKLEELLSAGRFGRVCNAGELHTLRHSFPHDRYTVNTV